MNGYPESEELYFRHEAHPLTRCAAETRPNWERLREYAEAGHEEWQYRWDRDEGERHESWAVVESLAPTLLADLDWPNASWSDPPQVTGGWDADDYVDACHYYYANEKCHLFSGKRDRSSPPWVDGYTVERGP